MCLRKILEVQSKTNNTITREDRQLLADEYTELLNSTAKDYNDSSRQLSNALLTASTAYMAISAALKTGDTPVLANYSMVSFLFSITFGLASFMRYVLEAKTIYNVYDKALGKIEKGTNYKNEQMEAESKSKKYARGKIDIWLIVLQTFLFTIGTIFTIILFFQ